MARRVAVTGASGHLGSSLLERLVADPSIDQVRTVDLVPPSVQSPKIEHHALDIRDPRIDRVFAGCSAVFHLAFVVLGYRPRREFDDINVGGSKKVFEAAARASVSQVIYTSSIAAYGVLPGQPDPIDEQTPRRYQPDFPYAAAKYDVEAFLDDFEPRHPDLVVTRLRPVIVIGPHARGPSSDSLRKHLWVSTSRAAIPLVWEGDVAQAILLAFQRRQGGAFVLAADDPLPGDALAAAAGWRCIQVPPALRRLAGRALHLSAHNRALAVDPGWLLHFDAAIRGTSQKAREVLGWSPECPTCSDVLRRYAAEVPCEATPAQIRAHRALQALTSTLP